jgi:hypothetical protein
MSYRTRRHLTSSTFKVGTQICKVFLDPHNEYQPGFWLWNVGFAVGKSKRQLNDWYNNRLNKRHRSLSQQIVGLSGMKTITRGFKEVLKLRWTIQPGDAIVLDCTSGDPDRQFRAWHRWLKHHPEWMVDYHNQKFFWYRPPYPTDPVRQSFFIDPITPPDLMANTFGDKYFECFRVRPKVDCTHLSMEQTLALLSQVLDKRSIL